MILVESKLGNCVDAGQAWFCNYGDSAFHEVGQDVVLFRVSFTPIVVGRYLVEAQLKHRMGDGSAHSRLYCKSRIVQVAPFYKSDFALFLEGCFEGAPGQGDQIRFLDTPMCPSAGVLIEESALGTVHTFAVEYMAGDGIQGQVGYGSTLRIHG